MSGLDLDRVERTMQALLSRSPLDVTYRDRSTGDVVSVSPEAAASRSGLLPAFLAAGQVVCMMSAKDTLARLMAVVDLPNLPKDGTTLSRGDPQIYVDTTQICGSHRLTSCTRLVSSDLAAATSTSGNFSKL
jgi:hypothetical protein